MRGAWQVTPPPTPTPLARHRSSENHVSWCKLHFLKLKNFPAPSIECSRHLCCSVFKVQSNLLAEDKKRSKVTELCTEPSHCIKFYRALGNIINRPSLNLHLAIYFAVLFHQNCHCLISEFTDFIVKYFTLPDLHCSFMQPLCSINRMA